jgi:hypothetical protein
MMLLFMGAAILCGGMPGKATAQMRSTDAPLLTPQQRLDSALSLLRSGTTRGPREATEILLSMPADVVVPPLVEMLQFDLASLDPTAKRLAFTVLSAHQSHSHHATYELLTDGLADPQLSEVCVKALRGAPPASRADIAWRLAGLLDRVHRDDPELTATVLQILIEYGQDAAPALNMLNLVLHDTATVNARNRVAAGLAIAEIGGLQAALDAYHDLDSTALKGALAGLRHLSLKTPDQLAEDTPQRAAARRLVLGAIAYPSVWVLQYAYEAIPAVYGEALFVSDEGPHRLHPEIKMALLEAARDAPTEEIRDALILMLQDLEQRAVGEE